MKHGTTWKWLLIFSILTIFGCFIWALTTEQLALNRTANVLQAEADWQSVERKLLCEVLAHGASIDDALVKVRSISGTETYGSTTINISFTDLHLAQRLAEIRVSFDAERKITRVERIDRIGSAAEERELHCAQKE